MSNTVSLDAPLALFPDFPERLALWRAWWRFEAPRPLSPRLET
jgi:hypothetical protein